MLLALSMILTNNYKGSVRLAVTKKKKIRQRESIELSVREIVCFVYGCVRAVCLLSFPTPPEWRIVLCAV